MNDLARSALGRPARWARVVPTLVAALAAAACDTGPRPPAGAEVLISRHGCAGCHVIPGVEGSGSSVGPPLTAIGKRVYVGGRLNTPQNLAQFIVNPSAHRPSAMPVLGVQPHEAEQLAAYLRQLR